MGQGAGARARQKAKREAWLKNMPYPGFICRGCKHEDMMHTNWFSKCIVKECDCARMDEVKGENK